LLVWYTNYLSAKYLKKYLSILIFRIPAHVMTWKISKSKFRICRGASSRIRITQKWPFSLVKIWCSLNYSLKHNYFKALFHI
jgi:hypothetical protein